MTRVFETGCQHHNLEGGFQVNSPDVKQDSDALYATYKYTKSEVERTDKGYSVSQKSIDLNFKTVSTVPKVGVMLVGLGGNNGSTVVSGIFANCMSLTWNTKQGLQKPNWFGSVTQASTVRLGATADGEEVHIPLKNLLPMVNPNDLYVGGWDISSMDLAAAVKRAGVLDYDLQRQLYPLLEQITPLPSIYYPDFIASNQKDRADNVVPGENACWEHVEHIRKDIRAFKAKHGLDKVIVLWTANTERFCDVIPGVHDTADNLLQAIKDSHKEVSQSTVFAVASALEGCSYINGSPQNTLVPGVQELARACGVFVGGDDFKSGQTKMKSVLVDFLVSAGLKPESIVSYNHLGNNDGKNLAEPKQFRSKEISKSNVVDDVVESNQILYPDAKADHPDHTVVIKYVPFVGDSKRAMDEYTSRIFMNGMNTIVMHNTCEDSLLAAPIIVDLVILTELCERIFYQTSDMAEKEEWGRMRPVLSLLSYLLKAPMVNPGAPVVNALFKQRDAIVNLLRAARGLPIDTNMLLEHRFDLDNSKNWVSPDARAPAAETSSV